MIFNYYDILNVPFDASEKDIKSSFRKLAKRYHPDLSSDLTDKKKLNLILEAYQVLGNETLKKEYDLSFFSNHILWLEGKSYVKIPKSRVEYVATLKNLAKTGLWKEKKITRKHCLESFGYDILIRITLSENKRGIVFIISLPAKEACRVCFGEDQNCYLCQGMGKISTTRDLEVFMPPNLDQDTTVNIDLKQHKPEKLSYFTLNEIIVRIHVLGGL